MYKRKASVLWNTLFCKNTKLNLLLLLLFILSGITLIQYISSSSQLPLLLCLPILMDLSVHSGIAFSTLLPQNGQKNKYVPLKICCQPLTCNSDISCKFSVDQKRQLYIISLRMISLDNILGTDSCVKWVTNQATQTETLWTMQWTVIS